MTGGADGSRAGAAWLDAEGRALHERVEAVIRRGVASRVPDEEFAALALALFAWQRRRCDAVDRVARAFAPGAIGALAALPGVPADAFKTARIACFAPEHTARVFHTSGTTRERPGRHEFADLGLYHAAALETARRYLLPASTYEFVLLAPGEAEAPHSSLTYMLARFAESRGAHPDSPWMIERGQLALDRLRAAIARVAARPVPVAVLGASFAFVHLHDALAPDVRWRLPPGSVVMPTGGFKGRSRELSRGELAALIDARFDVPASRIVYEYGMTELSSQAYEAHAVEPGAVPGRYVAPPWMRVDAVDPETLAVRPAGEPGILRIVDLANVGSVVAVQTADVGVVHPDGAFEVHGRAPGATPRGCARAMDALLTGEGDA